MLFSHFRKLDLSNFKMTFEERTLFMTDFQSSYKVLLLGKILFCYFQIKKKSDIELFQFFQYALMADVRLQTNAKKVFAYKLRVVKNAISGAFQVLPFR